MSRRNPSVRAGSRAVRWSSCPLFALTLALATSPVLSPSPAGAEPGDPAVTPEIEIASSAALLELRAPSASSSRPEPPSWMGEYMHFQKGTGFEYRRRLRMGDQPFELGLQGPIVRKKKSLGLTLVVRF